MTLAELLRGADETGDDPEARARAKAAVRMFFKAVAKADMAALADAVTDDVIYEMPFSESGSTEAGTYRRFVGRADVIGFWRATSGVGIKVEPPEDVEISVLGDGSRLFIEQRGDMTMPDGKRYRNRYVFRYDIRDGRVSYVREYINPIISAYAFGRPIAGGLMVETL